MCIHNVKPDAQGRPDRAKSRTVVLGNEEHRYWEKTDLFAPVIARHSVRALVAFGLSKGRMTKQCDAKNAFCHPTLPDDEICVVVDPSRNLDRNLARRAPARPRKPRVHSLRHTSDPNPRDLDNSFVSSYVFY